MKKYKIIEVNQGGSTWYEIRKRFLFFWFTETEVWCCPDGLSGIAPIEFDSIENAERYIKNINRRESVVRKFWYCPNGCLHDENRPDCLL